MQIRILGCSGGVGPGLRTTSVLVDDRLLIDAGTGVCDLDLDAMDRLTHVLLTHAHLDHVVGVAFVADNRFFHRSATLKVLAQKKTLDVLRAHIFNWEIWPDFSQLTATPDVPVLRFDNFNVGDMLGINGLDVTSFPVLHTVPAVGYAISDGSHCFAFTGDTYGDEAMWSALNAMPRVDCLMIEVAYPDEDEAVGEAAKHLTPARLGRELGKLEHRPELLLTHHKPGQFDIIVEQCRTALTGWRYRHLRAGDSFTV